MADPFRTVDKQAEDIVREHPELISIIVQSRRLTYGSLAFNEKKFPASDWDRCMVFALYWLLTAKDAAGQEADADAVRAAVRTFYDEKIAAALDESTYNLTGSKPAAASNPAKADATAALLKELGL